MTSAASGSGPASGGSAPGAGGAQPHPQQHHWSERCLSIGEKLAVILSLGAVIWLSHAQSEADLALTKRETTLALVTLSFSEPIFAAKEHLNREFSQNAGRYAPAALGVGKQSLPDDVRNSFVVLVEFYNSVAICHEADACDKELADQFFQSDACGFLDLYNENAKAKIEREYGASITDKIARYCAAAGS